jgi:hypothetical protein
MDSQQTRILPDEVRTTVPLPGTILRESRLSQLWLGPLYIDVLMARGKKAEAADRLEKYKVLVAECQSARFTAEVSRLIGFTRFEQS